MSSNQYGTKRFSRTKEEFIAFYKENLQAKITEIDAERQNYKKLVLKRLMLGSIGVVILFFIFLTDNTFFVGEESYLKWIMYFPLFIGLMSWSSMTWMTAKKKIEAKVKISIVDQLVNFMNLNFTYKPDDFIPRKYFQDAAIFKNRADFYTGDDLIEGYVYDEREQVRTNVTFCEVIAGNLSKISVPPGKKGKKRKTLKPLGMYVYGLFYKVDFNKDFGKSVTIVKPRWLLKDRKYRKKLALYGKKSPLQEVHLENPAFMKQFVVHSNDQINARVIFQADTMENLLKFLNYMPETISGKKAKKPKRKHSIPYFTFRRNQIYVIHHTKSNHFIVNIFEDLTIDTVYHYFEDINRVLRLIDDLNLNLDLYKK